jgi:hypothetical protein
MIIVLQAAGVVAVLVGLVAIGVGIPVKEFSFGNTLILSGTVGLCTGLILLGLSVVARELRLVAGRLAAPRPPADPRAKAALPPFPGQPGTGEGPAFSRDPSNAGQTEPAVASAAPPFELEPVPAASAPPQPPTKQRRNLMFSSSVRKDRERPPVAEPGEAPPASFEDAWPKPDRARPAEAPPQRRAGRLAPAESTGAERPAMPVPPPAPADAPPTVTVLKSGVVDGMAYSLYSDGSIEAQMPEGMMRFASIDELRAHLDQRL